MFMTIKNNFYVNFHFQVYTSPLKKYPNQPYNKTLLFHMCKLNLNKIIKKWLNPIYKALLFTMCHIANK